MSESDLLALLQAFLRAPPNTATPEQVLAWEDFFHKNDPLIRHVVRGFRAHWADIDDLSQEVWKTVVRRLLGLRLDRIRGTLRDWIAGVARRLACRWSRRRSRRHDEQLAPELADLLPDPDADLGDECQRADVRERIRAILMHVGARLSEMSRRVIVMRLDRGTHCSRNRWSARDHAGRRQDEGCAAHAGRSGSWSFGWV